MKRHLHLPFLLGFVLLTAQVGYAQRILSLSECHDLAVELSPLQKQILYLESISELNSESYKAINYPILKLNAQASYQSDVFSLPFQLPGIESPIIPQDQYKVAIDFYQNIYNGGVSRAATDIETAKMRSDIQALEISFHQVREVINSLYFGILKAQEQTKLIVKTQEDLDNQKKILEVANREGTVLSSSVMVLEKEILTLKSQLIEIELTQDALLEMLGKWIEQPLDNRTVLEIPEMEVPTQSITLNRAETGLFNSQFDVLESSKSQLSTSRIPDIGVFGTAGLGYPNPLNWFEVEFTPYWMVGLKLSWDILDYGKSKRDREILGLRQQSLMVQKQNFERTLTINLSKQNQDILKYGMLTANDLQIVELQEEIIAVASSQLQNGIISSNDYVLEVNKGLKANINLRLHEIDLAKSKVELLTLTGNTNEL